MGLFQGSYSSRIRKWNLLKRIRLSQVYWWYSININKNMIWVEIVQYILLSVVVIVNSSALFLLKEGAHSYRHANQVNIIAALCIYELVGGLVSILFYIVKYNVTNMTRKLLDVTLCVTDIYITFNYYFIMILLTIDRFLVFYLNMKYHFYLPPRKITSLIIVVSMTLFTCTIIAAIFIMLNKMSRLYYWNMLYLLYVIIDISYILLVMSVYIYIFSVYKRQKKIRKNCKDNNDSFKLLIPSLLIVTFIIFSIIPDLFLTGAYYQIYYVSDNVKEMPFILFRIGRIVDPLIYIFGFSFRRGRQRCIYNPLKHLEYR